MVVLFFLLSGFALAQPWMSATPQTYATFMMRRVTRIDLPYLAALAFSVSLMHLEDRSPLPIGGWFNLSWEHTIDARTVIDHLLMDGGNNWIDSPIRSLVWEMWISFIFPVRLGLPIRLGIVGLFIGTFRPPDSFWCAEYFALDPALVWQIEFGATYAGLFLIGIGIAMQVERFRAAAEYTAAVMAALSAAILGW